MRWGPAVCVYLLSTPVNLLGQWEVPGTLELTGDPPETRQVIGLADPTTPDAGISLDAARTQATNYTATTGSIVLSGTLHPAPGQYTAGMMVTVVPSEPNQANAMLDLNDLGPVPVVKGDGTPLDSADLNPGAPARLLFDGTGFVVISNIPRPCRSGYIVVSSWSCVEAAPRGPLPFTEANVACADGGGRICKFSEWTTACRTLQGFLGTMQGYEWVDSAANNADTAKLVGYYNDGTQLHQGCEYGGYGTPPDAYPFRCCMDR